MDRNTPWRPPIGVLILGAAIVLLLTSAAIAWLWLEWATLDSRYPFIADTLRIALYLGLISLPLYGVALGLQIAWRRWGDREFIRADKLIKLERARRQFPDTLQSLSYHDSSRALPPAALPDQGAPPALPPSSVPPFSQLLDSGQIGPGRPLILGYNAASGQPIVGEWKDLYSCGVGAQQGAGKTWLLAFLLAQSAAQGGRLIVCDLHAGDDESLANRIAGLARSFLCEVATTPQEIITAFKTANERLERRKTIAARWPIVLVCDEWTSLLRTAAGAELGPLVQNIAEQGRKFNVNGLLAAQAWTKAASSDVRNQLTSHYVLRQRPDEARYQLGLRSDQLPDDVRGLPDATGYLLNVRGELIKVIIPRMTAADIARAGELAERPAAIGQPFGFQLQTRPLTPPAARVDANGTQTGQNTANASEPTERLGSVSPEAARAAELFAAGKSIAAIASELRGADITKGGRSARPIREEIERLIREGLNHA